MPVTGPSHATMMTGLYPRNHKVVANAVPLGEEVTTLAELLAVNGYETHAVVSSFVLDRQFGLEQGFATYDDRFELEDSSLTQRSFMGVELDRDNGFDQRAKDASRKALEVIRGARSPFFLFVHFMDPHDPYQPPLEHASTFLNTADDLKLLISLYDGEIAYADAEIDRILDALPENTLIVFTSDHGEGLMDHGVKSHGFDLYEEQVRVPLILKWTGEIPAGKRIPEPVELTQIMPTVIELARLEADLAFDGASLLQPLLRDDPVYLHRRSYNGTEIDDFDVDFLKPYRTDRNYKPKGPKYGIRVGDYKFIQGGQDGPDEVYDLVTDPDEITNLREQEPSANAELEQKLDAWLQETESGDLEVTVDLSPETEEALEALGYFQ